MGGFALSLSLSVSPPHAPAPGMSCGGQGGVFGLHGVCIWYSKRTNNRSGGLIHRRIYIYTEALQLAQKH